MIDSKFIFTPENLIDNLDKLGAWSAYYLAEVALNHYFPELLLLDHDPVSLMEEQLKRMKELGLEYWADVIIKYHNEVGYNELSSEYVNEH